MIDIQKINNIINNEVIFSASKSSGPGGQNVNKVNTRIELRFDIRNSVFLTDVEKQIISEKLYNKITTLGILILTAGTERSQLQNKQLVIERFIKLIQACSVKPKSRKPTKPTKSSIENRLNKKRKQSVKKQLRNKPNHADE